MPRSRTVSCTGSLLPEAKGKPSHRRLLLVSYVCFSVLVAIAASCGGGSPSAPSRECRRYATSLIENGTSFQCSFEEGIGELSCRSGVFLTRTWTYERVDQFITEVAIPNRILALERSSTFSGGLGSFAQTRTSYRYDASGRLVERRRTGTNVAGSFEFDNVIYDAWDSSGRPTRGQLTPLNGTSEPVTNVYDDGARTMESSIGEITVLDANGNYLREVQLFGGSAGERIERVYETRSTAELCMPE